MSDIKSCSKNTPPTAGQLGIKKTPARVKERSVSGVAASVSANVGTESVPCVPYAKDQ